MDPVNLKKLAEQLNLSISTVSKAFRNSTDIKPETRDRILALARELNYEPNPLASSLRTQKSKTIALIIPEIANNFFTLAIDGIESISREHGYHVLIYLTHESHENEVAFTNHLQSGRVDGVLISLSDGNKDCSHLDNLQEKGIPVVFFDRVPDNCTAPKITTNDFESGYKATVHLIEKGCRKIAHLYYEKNLSVDIKRREGYLQALQDHQIPVNKKMLINCGNNHDKNYRRIIQVLAQHQPDGVFASFEKLAIQTYQACGELGLTIPRHVKLIGFSNLETAALLNPSLSTITQPAFEIGKQAAMQLFKSLDRRTAATTVKHTVIDATLRERRSTARK